MVAWMGRGMKRLQSMKVNAKCASNRVPPTEEIGPVIEPENPPIPHAERGF
jgi:hypothetical protein